MAEQDPRPVRSASLDDKYTTESGRVYLTGYQALVRLLMIQRERDRAAGLNTAGFVSGYRGSPLGGLDLSLWKAAEHLAEHDIVFQPGINEDLAATAVWGSQQLALSPKARVQGVFAMWYGKGPGVDRCGDVFRHANAAGSSRFGGVLAIAGDDHAAKSSTLPHQTDHFFKSMMMPVLAPAVIFLYWNDQPAWATFLLIWMLVVVNLDNFLRPWLIKRGADLPLLLQNLPDMLRPLLGLGAPLGARQQEQLLNTPNGIGTTDDGTGQKVQLISTSGHTLHIGVELIGLLFARDDGRRVLHQRHPLAVEEQAVHVEDDAVDVEGTECRCKTHDKAPGQRPRARVAARTRPCR